MFEIRPMLRGDVAAVAHLATASIETMTAYSQEAKCCIARLYDEAGWHAILDRGHDHAFVASTAARIAAIGMIKASYIRGVYVSPDLQRQGAGRQMVAVLERTLAAHGRTEVLLQANPDATAFYELLGYSIVDVALTTTQPSFQIVNMKKSLAQHGVAQS